MFLHTNVMFLIIFHFNAAEPDCDNLLQFKLDYCPNHEPPSRDDDIILHTVPGKH